ncbi:SRPBCC domain-containing protein [Sphingomonas sp. LM7]|uniref:SRPBCC domain-containing protein n=1 Tax=Sphingomonas sp. LM7 TaxID=1938607 RepID=UPI00098391C4|nr:SRPBCC domain-containing protein [Sphingomonas sp. LM7]AQR74161.1 ATPase [Sphingomonas sp. LM7]
MPANDETRELWVEKRIDAPIDAVWKAWTDHLEEWWCPKPWTTELIQLDLRAGGRAAMIMRGPDGEENAIEGVILEVVPGRKIVWSDVFKAGWVPSDPFMAGTWEFTPQGDKTLYRGSARHWSEEAYQQHKLMGFEAGWGVAARQLEAVAKRIAETADA